MKLAILTTTLAASLVIAGFVILYSGSKNTDAACEKSGGVYVKTYKGFACIKAEKVAP